MTEAHIQKKEDFAAWLTLFIDEKGLDPDHVFEVEGETWGTNFIPLQCIIDLAKQAPTNEQDAIKTTIVKIDFCNGDVMDYFKHLAKAVAI